FIVSRDAAAALYRVRAATMQPIGVLDDVRGASKGGIDIAIAGRESGHEVIRCGAMDPRRVCFERRPTIGHHRQQPELNFYSCSCVFSNVGVSRENHRNRFADMDSLISRKNKAIALLLVGTVG